LTLDWHASPTSKRQSYKSTKPRSGKRGTLPVIQAPRVRLLDQPLRKTVVACLHQTDKDKSETLNYTIGRSKVDARLAQNTAFRGIAGTGQARRQSCSHLNSLTLTSSCSDHLAAACTMTSPLRLQGYKLNCMIINSLHREECSHGQQGRQQ
jgi:hypothetical protein